MRTPTLLSLFVSSALAFGAAMPVHAQPTPVAVAADATLVTISAEAEAQQVPDVAILSTGVVTQAADGNGAMRENAVQMDKVMKAVRAAGIAERDIRTSGISLNPQYRYAENQPPTITGYQAVNTVSLKVRQIAGLGKVLDALAAAGANQINGPSFEIDQPEPLYDQARVAALKKAQARAEIYAAALGLKVRRIVSLSEAGRGGGVSPVPMMSLRMAKAEMDTAVSPGENTVSVSLDVVFELGR